MFFQTWRVIICIADGIVTAFDSQFYQSIGTIPDNKGCHLVAIFEKQNSVIVANKKKLTHYSWLSPGFNMRKEFNLADVPKVLHHISGMAIVGYKKFYECIDLTTGTTSRLMEVEKEHKMIVVDLVANQFRGDALLLSLGQQGILVEQEAILHGGYINPQGSNVERLEWSAVPNTVHVMTPFILSTLSDSSVEVHDLLTLAPLQKISIVSPSGHMLSLSVCCEDGIRAQAAASPFLYHSLVCNSDQLLALRMTPLTVQVNTLITNGMFEEAINLCQLCPFADKREIDLIQLHESSANTLMIRGDFPKAIDHFIQANTQFLSVAKQFPDFIPLSMHVMFGITQTKKLTGNVLHRAAAAVVTFCQFHRLKLNKRGERAEKMKELGIIGATSLLANSYKKSVDYDEDEDYIADPDEEIRKCQLLDTMMLFALMHCSPDRKQDVLTLLSSSNRCQIESCSVLLASHGNTYTEALLWLYRSQNQHQRVLQALTEDKCVAIGAWSREQFYNWTADYLRWLWYCEDDASLPRQALLALKPLLEYDAELGLSVLVSRPPSKTSFGGKGVTIGEVLSFLRSCSPKINYSRGRSGGSAASQGRQAAWQTEKAIATVLSSIPLLTGHALAVAFLECLVSSGEAPPSLHDDFAQLLVEGILQSGLPPSTPVEVANEDSEELTLYKIYRKKLQSFLANSNAYHPQKVLKVLSQEYFLENALILSKLGRHRDVLKIYVSCLRRIDLAEIYCDRVYTIMKGDPRAAAISMKNLTVLSKDPHNVTIAMNLPSTLSNASEIYLILFQVCDYCLN